MSKMKTGLTLGLVIALLGLTNVKADPPTLDFTVPAGNHGASVSYAGGAAPLLGSNISITQVTGLSTPLNADPVPALPIQSGSLNFTAGNWTSSPDPNSWDFGAGPSGGIKITGGVSALGIALGTQLLTGQIEASNVSRVGGTFKVAIAMFVDHVNAVLASHYGLLGGSTYLWSGDFNVGFHAPGTAPGAFASTNVTSGDVLTSPVPEPSTMAIAGLGALGLIGFGLRRRKGV